MSTHSPGEWFLARVRSRSSGSTPGLIIRSRGVESSQTWAWLLESVGTGERLSLSGAVTRTLEQGATLTIAKEAIHQVRRAGNEPTITLHAYPLP